jgi:hypothetical protein
MALVWCVAGLSGGCLPAWRPPMDRVQPAVARTAIDLTRFARPGGRLPRVYLRRDLSDADAPPVRYERRPQNGMLTEGLLADKRVTTVAAYLQHTPDARQRRGVLWPEDPDKKGAAFFLEFDPPLLRLPASIDVDGGVSQHCRLRYYNRDAVEVRGGTVTRRIVFEGFESVEAGGIEYPACPRLRIDTRYRIHWGPRVDTSEYVWLAPGIGEVRRVERLSGLAWLAYFTGLHVYELIEQPLVAPAAASSASLSAAGPQPIEAWSRCAVYLDRVLPHPRLGGLAVELAPAQENHLLAVTGPRPE